MILFSQKVLEINYNMHFSIPDTCIKLKILIVTELPLKKRKSLSYADPGWMPAAHHSCSITPLSQPGRGEKIRLMGGEKDREISQQLLSWAKHTQLREINLLPIKSQSKIIRNKNVS